MMIEGKHKCEYCREEFMWFYKAKQKTGSHLFDVETTPEDKVGLYKIGRTMERSGYKIPLDAGVYCPKCDRLNYIEIEEQCF